MLSKVTYNPWEPVWIDLLPHPPHTAITDFQGVTRNTWKSGQEGIYPLLTSKGCAIGMVWHEKYPGLSLPPTTQNPTHIIIFSSTCSMPLDTKERDSAAATYLCSINAYFPYTKTRAVLVVQNNQPNHTRAETRWTVQALEVWWL